MVRQWYADGGDARFRFDYDLAPDSRVLDLGVIERVAQELQSLATRERPERNPRERTRPIRPCEG